MIFWSRVLRFACPKGSQEAFEGRLNGTQGAPQARESVALNSATASSMALTLTGTLVYREEY